MPADTMPADPFEIIDRRFRALILPICWLEVLAGGMRWCEGPVYMADSRALVWSDIPNNRLMRWCEETGSVGVFRADSDFANGNTRDRQGRLVTCEHRTRRLTRTEWDGTITVLADSHAGKRLNSPNDVVVKSDGTIWFTDPTYGIAADYEGGRAEPEQDGRYVYRLDPRDGSLAVVADDFVQPNGLAFSPDESLLYIADSGLIGREEGPRHIRAFKVGADNRLSGGAVVTEVAPHAPDGFRVDEEGNIWSSAGDGVHCYTPSGDLLGKIRVPERVGNLTFGGSARNRLFICGHTSLYAVFVNARGAQRP
ncbi:SMP-30/gluconolactonase/LRE family protein [Ancylobacter sp. 6x-1]|uniref:SMP-30/gluconolactonase/LRE family protein n=1 Tax=Ancylobacter crimeensis TaxID=2579147 RepID=A0ABT0D821_9HYPH|nr:SMP-30/gluconolactonase/LRE family protein [Ancylobacter crimeensis]MCK0196108.1 SMP-30/gluconolactonase/LRE family protein [Ancylobacter crimeensis]